MSRAFTVCCPSTGSALETFHITEGECVGQDIIVVHRHPILKEIVTGALEGREMERIMEIDGRNYQLLGNRCWYPAALPARLSLCWM